MKVLNDKELSKISLNDLEVQLASEKLKSARLANVVLELRIKCLSNELEKARNEVASLSTAETAAKEARAATLSMIAKKKGLTPGWGFNPDNGEIIEQEN